MNRYLWIVLGLWLGITALRAAAAGTIDPDPDYDRLDGTGKSGKTVQVIEWEGNLEIHVMPKGSLIGLALKLDSRDKSKKVMVIGYRFDNDPKQQLIRRNILDIDLHEGFKAYRDPSADDYDKIIVSNNGLSDQVTAFALDPEPKQLYPEGHPALAAKDGKTDRAPAAAPSPASAPAPTLGTVDEDSGAIKPFKW